MNRYSIRKVCLDHIYFASLFDETTRYLMLNNTYLEAGMTGFEAPGDDEATIKMKQT